MEIEKDEKLQSILNGEYDWLAVELYLDNLTPDNKERYYRRFVIDVAIAKRFGTDKYTCIKEKICRYLEQTTSHNANPTLPKELDNDKAKTIFDKAEKEGFIIKNGNLYKWNKTNENTYQLLSYFCEKMSRYLNLSKKLDKYGNPTTSWKPFEKLFGVKNLISYKNDWLKYNTKFEPNGYERIDALFE